MQINYFSQGSHRCSVLLLEEKKCQTTSGKCNDKNCRGHTAENPSPPAATKNGPAHPFVHPFKLKLPAKVV